jgi:hypothetical protein
MDQFWNHFDELKTLKSIDNKHFSCFFMIFGKLKKTLKKGAVARTIFGSILEIRGSQNPPFRASAIAGLPADTLTQ